MTIKTSTASRGSFLLTLALFREIGLSIFILILVAVVTIRSPDFLTLRNLNEILMNISVLVIVALAQTMVMITHGIDLSVSSMIGLVAIMVAAFVKVKSAGFPMPLAILLGMALGAVLGMVNGLIITFGKVPPIIATLGTLSIYRGLVSCTAPEGGSILTSCPIVSSNYPKARRWGCPIWLFLPSLLPGLFFIS